MAVGTVAMQGTLSWADAHHARGLVRQKKGKYWKTHINRQHAPHQRLQLAVLGRWAWHSSKWEGVLTWIKMRWHEANTTIQAERPCRGRGTQFSIWQHAELSFEAPWMLPGWMCISDSGSMPCKQSMTRIPGACSKWAAGCMGRKPRQARCMGKQTARAQQAAGWPGAGPTCRRPQ